MRIFRHYQDIPEGFKGGVLAIGNFDGVHRGHQALLAETRRLAAERNAIFGVLAFEPHPQEYFRPNADCFRLTPFRTKTRLIAAQGADALFALAFDRAMAGTLAQDFIVDVLVGGLSAGAVVVGADFQFGKGRAGNTAVLAYMGEMEGFGVTIFSPVEDERHGKISSSRIRKALKEARPREAADLLGHFWTIESRVEHGDGRGRAIGIPTANMRIDGYLVPAFGVYAVRATIMEEDRPAGCFDGVANLGIRPMFESPVPLLETWLFDFSGDLYGKHLAVELVEYLRPEARFDNMEALKVQIEADAKRASAVLDALKRGC
ncbi:MAG TPA: bifunctional riboflavin kinase/FAD synthetase [Rhizomicrobium sp.]|jgi:riboflavin kinase/FMN adenylyltransferase|nr:bifunctional riboflavin kinase/FAD synthetase [Rhizomicrobium sp.]